MNKKIWVRGVRRKQPDEEKLAHAFLVLAGTLRQRGGGAPGASADELPSGREDT